MLLDALSVCSTPFGIIGIHTSEVGGGLFIKLSGAQRLSASLEFTQEQRAAIREAGRFVLNAFRHHWNSHGPLTYVPGEDSLVLNAFRHHWNSHRVATPKAACIGCRAQRLSASLEFTLGRRRNCGTGFHVLNAFRHHWNSHDSQLLNVQAPIPQVLNAFRHHWNSHGRWGWSMWDEKGTCSTPFGIIGIHTSFLSRSLIVPSLCAQRLSASLEFTRCISCHLPPPNKVLNAFRHHWNSHTTATLPLG